MTNEINKRIRPRAEQNQENARQDPVEKTSYDEKGFRLALNNDAMATEKLSEGIRLFCADTIKLEKMIDELR